MCDHGRDRWDFGDGFGVEVEDGDSALWVEMSVFIWEAGDDVDLGKRKGEIGFVKENVWA